MIQTFPNLNLLPADQWIQPGNSGNTGGASAKPHGTFTLTPGNPLKIQLVPAPNYDDYYYFTKLAPSAPLTSLKEFSWSGEFSFPAQADFNACNAPEWEMELCINGTVWNMGWQLYMKDFPQPEIRMFDYNSSQWVPFGILDLSLLAPGKTLKITSEHSVDDTTETHVAITINGQRKLVGRTQKNKPNRWGPDANYLHYSFQFDGDSKGTPYTACLGNMSATCSDGITKPDYAADLEAAGAWIEKACIAPDGAILYGQDINPYYANLAAIGMCKRPASWPAVKNWMMWYITHLNCPDKWGMAGTVYDYTAGPQSKDDADSTDSYAAIFLSLAWAYFNSGDPSAHAYIKSIVFELQAIAQVISITQQADGLTFAKPDYQIKYLMDNCEAYRGLRDLASLLGALGITASQKVYNVKADAMLSGILSMYSAGSWLTDRDEKSKPNLVAWYPDATAQLFPIAHGVISPQDQRAQATYAAFVKAWPSWETLSFNSQDSFPWVVIAYAAALMGDRSRVDSYIKAIESKYVKAGFPWSWYCAEAGWFMRLNALLK